MHGRRPSVRFIGVQGKEGWTASQFVARVNRSKSPQDVQGLGAEGRLCTLLQHPSQSLQCLGSVPCPLVSITCKTVGFPDTLKSGLICQGSSAHPAHCGAI